MATWSATTRSPAEATMASAQVSSSLPSASSRTPTTTTVLPPHTRAGSASTGGGARRDIGDLSFIPAPEHNNANVSPAMLLRSASILGSIGGERLRERRARWRWRLYAGGVRWRGDEAGCARARNILKRRRAGYAACGVT